MSRRPRYADVVATLALVVALGGTTAYAAQALPKHSVGKAQLRKDAVTSAKIKNGKVTGVDLAPGTVVGSNLADNAVTSAKIAGNTVGQTDLAQNSVGGSELAANSVSTPKLADSSVTGAKIANNTVALDDLVGVDVNTTTTYSLVGGACVQLSPTVAGAQVGQAVVVTLTGAVAPGNVVFGPARVTGPGAVSFTACNPTSATVSATNLGLRVVTFG